MQITTITQKYPKKLKLYAYGNCDCDQFPHSVAVNFHLRKPKCISDLQQIEIEESNSQQAGSKIVRIINPIYGKTIYKIACGSMHSIVLTSQGKVYTFGNNDQGCLGRSGPESIPGQVKLDEPIDLIAAGQNHSYFSNSVSTAIYFTGSYKYFRGENIMTSIRQPHKFYASQIDTKNRRSSIFKIESGANHTIIIIGNKIYCRGQPQSFTTGRRINQRRKVSNCLTFESVGLHNVIDAWCGHGYTTVAKIRKNGQFAYMGWGRNERGQLGINSYESQNFPVQITKLRGKDIKMMTGGQKFNMFLTQEGEVMGCGLNEDYELGLGEDYQYQDSEEQVHNQESQGNHQNHLNGQNHLNPQIQPPQPSGNPLVGNRQASQQLRQQPQQRIMQNLQSKPRQEMQQKSQQQIEMKQGSQPNMSKQQHQNRVQIEEQIKQSRQNIQAPLNQQMQIESKPQPVQLQRMSQAQLTRMEHNGNIKTIKKVPIPQKVDKICSGELFNLAWNKKQLYTWGYGQNYVLLNGEQRQQSQPFAVKPKLLNNQILHEVAAGSNHVIYTAYQEGSEFVEEKIKTISISDKYKLSRKKR